MSKYADDVLFIVISSKPSHRPYEVLADPKKRDLYDRGGEQAIKEGGIASEMHNPMDIIRHVFRRRPWW